MEIYGMTGERLGFIGVEQPAELPSKLAKWKQDFLVKPSVSIRRGIAWGYKPPFEDTDTVVLTAPSGRFVDIRLPKDAGGPLEAANHQSFWSFSGRAITTFHDATDHQHAIDMPYTAHCKFLHDIDSRGPGISDEGDMFLLMNGDCLEMGIMKNPVTGKEELYKEYWHGAEKLPNPDDQDDEKTCLVACASSPSSVEGILIRLGGRVQGLISRQDETGRQTIEVERWTRDCNSTRALPLDQHISEVPPGPWTRDVRSSGFLPGGWLCLPGRQIGDTLDYNGIHWQVTEVHL